MEQNQSQPEGIAEQTGRSFIANGKLSGDTNLGFINLRVSNLPRSLDFYQQVIGLQVEQESGSEAFLGVGGETLVVLTEKPGAVRVPRRSGLYHFALLTPSRNALGNFLRNLVDTETGIQGGADHLVSEAIYLADPDGNGIEVYRDRPRNEWQYENGQIKMTTDPLDYRGILDSAQGSWSGLEAGTRLGHMHLHIAYLDQSVDFYEHVLGFDFLLNFGGTAGFLSAGGYHHHVGLNTWNGVGAEPNPPDAIGLEYFTVNLTGEQERQDLVARLEQAGWSYEVRDGELFVCDPSQNAILFQV
jgi:catechol 2,3-dioxygenase